jgi:zinc protease
MRRALRSFAGPIAFTVLFAPSLAAAGAPPLPAGVARVASVEGITEYRLDNGLRVLLFPDPSKPTATVNITYLVGSRHEGYGETGMAHLLEHMVFKGSPRHPNVPQELTSHGSRPNGTTWYDRTNYFETFAASEENLDWALDLEADRMVNCFLRAEDLASEFTVVRNEFELGENFPLGVLQERVLSTMYLWHNYGKSTIGARADIERVPIGRLRAFYERYYQPDNAVLVVAGRFDEQRTLGKIATLFGAIPKPTRVLERTWTEEPAQDGERTVALTRVGDVQGISVGYHVPAGAHTDWAAVEVLAQVLADTPSGRLHKALVEAGLASGVSALAKEGHDPSFLLLEAEVRKEKDLAAVRDAFLATVDGVLAQAPTEREVQRAKDALLKGWETTMRNSERAAIALSEWIGVGDWRLLFLFRDRIEAVAAADVARVAGAYLKPENRTVGLFTPTAAPRRAAIPPAPEVEALVASYQGRAALDPGEVFDPAPAAIEARLERRTLPSGLDVVVLAKDTRGDTVNVALTLNLGSAESLAGRRVAGSLVPRMLMRGTARRSREEIQDELDRLKTQLQIGGGPAALTAALETTRANLPAALALLGEVLREPAFPATELEILRQERLSELEEAKTDPFALGGIAFARKLRPYAADDPRYAATPDEEIAALAALGAADLRAFWADFYGASDGELAVIGDVDREALAQQIDALFGDWRSNTPFRRLAERYAAPPAVLERIETPDKENAMFLAGQRLELSDRDPDYPAMVLANFMTGGGFLNSRLATRLRQKEGLSYGAGSQLAANAFDRDGAFTAFAIHAPQNGERLRAAFVEEIERLLAAGFTEPEIAEAKQGLLQRQQVSRGVDRELARTLATRAYQGRTLAWDEEIEKRLAALTPAELQAAVKRYLDPAAMVVVQAGDFARAAATAGAPAATSAE